MWDFWDQTTEAHGKAQIVDFSGSPEVGKALKRFPDNSWAAATIPEGSFLSLLPVFINELRTE